MTTTNDDLRSFIYGQVDDGYVFTMDMAYIILGGEKHEFYVWAMRGHEPELLVDQFKRDIDAWVSAAGAKPTIVMRAWPVMSHGYASDFHQLHCRMLVVNRFYRDVPPSFRPKPQGEEAQIFGGTDES